MKQTCTGQAAAGAEAFRRCVHWVTMAVASVWVGAGGRRGGTARLAKESVHLTTSQLRLTSFAGRIAAPAAVGQGLLPAGEAPHCVVTLGTAPLSAAFTRVCASEPLRRFSLFRALAPELTLRPLFGRFPDDVYRLGFRVPVRVITFGHGDGLLALSTFLFS